MSDRLLVSIKKGHIALEAQRPVAAGFLLL